MAAPADCVLVGRASNNEKGMALLIVLIILLLIGLIAVVGAQEAQLQTRMSANSQHHTEASYHAETWLIRCERRLDDNVNDGSWTLASFSDGSVSGLHSLADGSTSGFDPLDSSSWDHYGGMLDDEGRSATSHYVIEYLGRVGPMPLNEANAIHDRRPHAFRLSVRADVSGAVSVVQSDVHLEVP